MHESKEPWHLREVKVTDLFIYFVIPLLFIIGLTITFVIGLKRQWLENYWLIIGFIVLLYIPLRMFAIGCVLLYKAFAPLKVRNRCRYQPTCSTYMIISIKKYGLILGILLGLKRIHNCHPPYGGFDYPSLSKLFKKNQ